MLNEHFTLSNGVKIPKIGLGTWQISTEDVVSAVKAAIRTGYRHIDTAVGYGNERGVAQGIKESGVPREEIFITTKIPAEAKSYECAKDAIEKSLTDLDTHYVDQMLIHAPWPWADMGGSNTYFTENAAVWKAFEEGYQAGKLKSIGVSNFAVKDLENILNNCTIKPHANQISYHIGKTQKDVVDFCNKNNILVVGYSPIATGRLLNNPQIQEIADKYGVSLPQICIKFVLQQDVLPIPKSTNEERIRQNADMNFEISAADMETLIRFE